VPVVRGVGRYVSRNVFGNELVGSGRGRRLGRRVERSADSGSASAGVREAAALLGAGTAMSVVPIPSGSVPNKIRLPRKKPTVPAALADATRILLGIMRLLLPRERWPAQSHELITPQAMQTHSFPPSKRDRCGR
jgi:hypothetical protein